MTEPQAITVAGREARRHARLAFVHLVLEIVAAAPRIRGGTVVYWPACIEASKRFNAGEALTAPDIRAVMPRVSPRSALSWLQAYIEHGEDGLADKWGASRGLSDF